MLEQITQMFSNPMVSHLLTFAVGWVALPQLAMFKKLWALVMVGSKAVDEAQRIVAIVDAVLKQNGVVAPDVKTDVEKVMKSVGKQ